ncbi:MAG: cation transporter [Desulfamplus sp.]|nr:cation transporter [Desulfamplus sp.]
MMMNFDSLGIDRAKCERCGERVALVGIVTNVIMVIMKLIVGVTSGSKACLADGLHSTSNIVTAFAIIVSQKLTKKAKSESFPFGFGKVEFIAAGFTSLFIIGAAIMLITASIDHLMREPTAPPHLSAILAAIISILANEMLFRYMRCVGTRLKSQTMMANAWANRADAFSSMAVIVGVLGSRLGFHHLDPICALVVVAIIIKVSISILIESIKSLMDSSVNHLYGEEITEIISNIEGVHGIADLKTRHIGQKIWAEVDIKINADCTMEHGENIAAKVKSILLEQVNDLERVIVHLKPLEE